MLYTSVPRISSDSSALLVMQRVCDQIQQQIQLMLSNLQAQGNRQLNSKMIQKCISSTKQAIIKLLNLKLPQIVAIQDKCKSLVIQINEELQNQIEKYKDLFSKYEQKILQNDRYKMEIVQLHELCECEAKQNIPIKQQRQRQMIQSKHQIEKPQFESQMTNKSMQTSQKQYKYIQSNDYSLIQRQLLQKKQERELYFNQITKYNEIIQEMKRNQLAANQKIQQLLQEIKTYHQMLEDEKQTESLLKKQIEKLVFELQQQKFNNEEQTDKHKQQIRKIQQNNQYQKKQFEKQLKMVEQQNQNNKSQQQKLKQQIRQLNLNFKQKSDDIKRFQDIIVSKDEQISKLTQDISQLKNKLATNQSTVQQLEIKAGKIGDITKWQQTLQTKYMKKIDLLMRRIKENDQKLKHSKLQNQRLYLAMDQYAGKQLKLIKKLNEAQAKTNQKQIVKRKQDKMIKNLTGFVINCKNQIIEVRKNLMAQSSNSIRSMVKCFKQSMVQYTKQCQTKWNKKIKQTQDQLFEQREVLLKKVIDNQKQYKKLQEKCLQSQLNSGKVANSILQSKNEICIQLARKDEIIMALQKQLAKEKQFNESSAKRISEVVKKYEKYQTEIKYIEQSDYGQQKDRQCLQLERKLIEQRGRFIGLQCEYQSLVNP